MKFGLCLQSPVNMSCISRISTPTKALTTLSNNTNVKFHWINMLESYNKFLTKRAFLHHYIGEGMEEETFSRSTEGILKLIEEYKEMEKSY